MRTVCRIVSDKMTIPTTTFESPQKRYDQSRQRIVVDDFDRDAIRRKIHHLYEQKQHFTLNVILEILQEGELFHGGRSSLASLLNDMGFKYKKINDKR